MICPRCKENVMDGSSFCVKCGYNFNANNNQQMSNQVNNNTVPNNANNFNNNLNSNVNGNNSTNNNLFNENKKGNNKIVIGVIAVALVSTVGFFGYKFFTNKNGGTGINNGNNNYDSTTIGTSLIPNENDMYAIFNYKGNKVTDFIYSSIDENGFRYGSAIVSEKGGSFLVSEGGKELTKPGEYSRLYMYNVLYDAEVKDSDSLGYYLSTKGKRLFSKDEYEIVKTDYFNVPFSIVKNIKTNEISCVGSNGEILATMPSNGSTINPTFKYSEKKGYLSVFYGNKSYIIDINNNKLLSSFSSNDQYCFNSYNENTKLLITSLCNTYDKKGKRYYMAFKDNKDISSNDFDTKCSNSSYGISFKDDNTICSGYGYIFDKDLKYIGSVRDYNYIIDFNNYIKDGKVYKNGNEVKTLSCLQVVANDNRISVDGFYHLRSLKNSKCNGDGLISLYDVSGNKVSNSSYYYMYDFDDNGLAIAGDKDRKFFLINKKGEKISDSYDKVELSNKYYIVTLNNKKGVVDTNGKLVVPCDYSNITINSRFDLSIAELYNNVNGNVSCVIKNLNDNKEIYSGTNTSVILYQNYLNVYDSDNRVNIYYSYYTGKEFHRLKI